MTGSGLNETESSPTFDRMLAALVEKNYKWYQQPAECGFAKGSWELAGEMPRSLTGAGP